MEWYAVSITLYAVLVSLILESFQLTKSLKKCNIRNSLSDPLNSLQIKENKKQMSFSKAISGLLCGVLVVRVEHTLAWIGLIKAWHDFLHTVVH